MNAWTDHLLALSDADREQLEGLLFEFDQAWSADRLAQCVGKLPSENGALRLAARVEMVKIDMERRRKAGEPRSLESYLGEFPELGTAETVSPVLIAAEFEIRRLAGETVDLAEIDERFPQQAETARQLIEQARAESSQASGKKVMRSILKEMGNAAAPAAKVSIPAGSIPQEFGRYQILRKIGEGAMGAVYLAHDTQLGRQVALKTPNFSGGESKDLIERFYREARSAATLQHANICSIHDVGDIDGVHYITMAYIDGKDLSDFIDADKQLPLRSIASVVRKLAQALDHAHTNGVIHRDLKPANIMIDRQGQPHIMDFGLARRLDKPQETRVTQDGMVLGTPAYMSPEQVQGDMNAGAASDVYSLGAIFYELLTGELPFQGSLAAVFGQIMTQAPPRPSEVRADVDPQLEVICLKMLAKNPADRYESMQEVATALRDFLLGKSGTASSAGRATDSQVDRAENEALRAMLELAQGEAPMHKKPAKPRMHATGKLLAGIAQLPLATKWAIGLAAMTLLVLLSVVLLIRTPDGTLRIEVTGDDIDVFVNGETFTLKGGEGQKDLRPGEYALALKIAGAEIPFDAESQRFSVPDGNLLVKIAGAKITGDSFEIVRKGTTVMTIAYEKQKMSAPVKPGNAEVSRAEKVTVVLQEGRSDFHGVSDVQIEAGSNHQYWNLGGWEQFGIWQHDDGVALLRFDLSCIPASAKILDARLELLAKSAGFAPEEINRAWTVGVYEFKHTWEEGTGKQKERRADGATNKTYDGKNLWPNGKIQASRGQLLGTVIHRGAARKWYAWSLKETVFQEWISGKRKNHGMMIYGKAPGKAVAFASRQFPEVVNRPILRLSILIPSLDLPKLGNLLDSDIKWQSYIDDCGNKAQDENEAKTEELFRKKYKNRIIRWTGIVNSVSEQLLGKGYLIGIQMQPTESNSSGSDVALSASVEFKNQVLALKRGQMVTFVGRIAGQGGTIRDHGGHSVELIWLAVDSRAK